MKASELAKLGIPKGDAMQLAGQAIRDVLKRGISKRNMRKQVRAVVAYPQGHLAHADYGALAAYLVSQEAEAPAYTPREAPALFQTWGADIDTNTIQQMANAVQLPVAVRGALMPDAHLGYGLPIGGVLATRNAVIPYAVGVDIACRMKLTVLDLPATMLTGQQDRLRKTLREETTFGPRASQKRRDHEVMAEDWGVTPLTQQLKDRAWSQLGSSGGGNHFVEFGILTVADGAAGDALAIAPGTYLTLLSHSGSRGAGSTIADHYSKLAMERHPELPKQLCHLAWLDLDTAEGQEYWAAMELMGRYASANHACIHYHIAKALGAEALLTVENHHNFAWQEEHLNEHGERETLIVHRKGATPAGTGALGVIPGSMATPAYVVRGKGVDAALDSASHGAGRRFSRRAAKESFTWSETKKLLAECGVTLLSAGLDEVPMAYKDIDEVMAAQMDLIEVVARFDPKLVRMAAEKE